ncbi:hypothetical protein T265_11469 [Opisthorchis viverrini]|uniref:Uncharacterized protein n=1 Tax=Opisthorchis viverrini TaxID=6198 RepID=A0A074Z2V8_OPIVI|nr:hypothetical protein T265_11469 [Opisthorchis viverrini]KER19857.1 hypothetical protein T265_11469 [Opisthorchis viverrini]
MSNAATHLRQGGPCSGRIAGSKTRCCVEMQVHLSSVGRWNVPNGRQIKFQGSACPKMVLTEQLFRDPGSRLAAGSGLEGRQASKNGKKISTAASHVCANRLQLGQKMQTFPNSLPSLKDFQQAVIAWKF